jgi:hypothetical protein
LVVVRHQCLVEKDAKAPEKRKAIEIATQYSPLAGLLQAGERAEKLEIFHVDERHGAARDTRIAGGKESHGC